MLKKEDINALNWAKAGDLMPAIVQDACSGQVLMLGFMNREAVDKTLESGKVTFWSRTKRRLWTKGETSEHWLHLVDIGTDCDRDSLLILANPNGPTCHRGTTSCFSPIEHRWNFLRELEASKAAAVHHRKNPIRPVFMPRAPSALRRKSAKKA